MSRISRGSALTLLLLLMLMGIWLRNAERLRRPMGLHDGEITDIRIVKSIQQGDIRVFYVIDTGMGRESLYHGLVAPIQLFFQHPTLGYHLVALWAAALTMAFLFALVNRLGGRAAALFAVAAWGLGFVPVLLSRNIGRESLLALPVLATMLLLTRRKISPDARMQHSAPNRIRLFFLSATVGFSLYLHPSAFNLTLGCALYLLISFRRQREHIRSSWPYWLFALVMLTIIALPNAISTFQDPTLAGVARWLPIQAGDWRAALNLPQIITNIAGFFLHGAEDVTINIPGRPLFDPLSAMLTLVGLLVMLRRWREPNARILLLMSAVLAIPGLLAPNGPDFLAFAPLLPILTILFGTGVVASWRWLAARGGPTIIGYIASSALVLILFFITRQDLFSTWPAALGRSEAFHRTLQVLARHLDTSAREIPSVVCAVPSSSAPQRLNDADILQLMLTENDLPIRFADCRQGLVLIGGGERQQYLLTETDALEASPSWFQEWLVERGEFREIGAELGFPLTKQAIQFDVFDPLATKLGGFTTTRPLRYPREQERTVAPAIRYGGNLTFLGYEFVAEGPYAPGSNLPIDFFWRVDGGVPEDIRIYLHLVFNEADLAQITAQADTVSVAPESLEARDIWVHRVQLYLPETTPPGDYRLLLGAYSKDTGDRMPVYDRDDGTTVLGDYLLLPDIQVAGRVAPDG